jgi:2-amino-4-hydroxy-6-hydroxymethyldihydropteridine diphosphokinase
MMAVMGSSELAFIGLGANVGAARASLVRALTAIRGLPGASLEGVSRLYRTRPVGPVAQVDFLNAVAALRVPAGLVPADGAMALLVALKGIERALGRVERERWGPREVDLDLLLFGDHRLRVERDAAARSDEPTRWGAQWLEVPHPEAVRRTFVLAPLADLAPDHEPPGWGSSVTEALTQARGLEGDDAVKPIAAWHTSGSTWIDL